MASDPLREAAIHAEYESGHHEATVDAARAHIAVRVARISAGTLLTLLGVAIAGIAMSSWWFLLR